MRVRTILAAAVVLVLGLLVGGRTAKAVTLVPPSLEYSVSPGDTVNSKVKLFNETADPLTLTFSTANFKAKGEGGEPDFTFDAVTADLASWVTAERTSLTLAAGERVEVPITIKVPANAEPGGHYAGLFFGTGASASEGSQIGIQSKIGTLLILKVAGDISEQARIVESGVDGGAGTVSRLPVDLFARIENSGNVHVRPQGTIIIRNLFGGESARITVNDTNGAVLPRSVRRFDSTWSKGASDTVRGGFFSEIAAEWRNFGFGPYTATFNLTYGEDKKPLVGTVKFTVFPWRLFLVETLVLVLVILGLVFGIRSYNAAIIRRAQKLPPPTKRP